MNRASFLLKIALITIFHVLIAKREAVSDKPNQLGTITEVTVCFVPAMAITEFNCKTRYNVSEARPISLNYNDQQIHTVSQGQVLSHQIEDAEPGEYKLKIGSDEFKFELHNLINSKNQNIIEIAYHVNLVTGRTRIEYESSDISSIFQCQQNGIYMEIDYHDILGGIENKGFNGTLELKTKTSYKCYMNNDQFEFSAINNVEDLYPRINSFQIHVSPKNSHENNFDVYVSCQTRTAKNPKVFLFSNQYQMVAKNFGNHAFYKSEYKEETAFKCIVENEYGRDVISWDGQNLQDYLNQKDSFTYMVDADKEITKMIYKPAKAKNLNDVKCTVKEKNEFYQYKIVTNNNVKKEFIEALDKYVQYTCKLTGEKEFDSSLYTKDWLHVPKIASTQVTARLEEQGQFGSPYWLTIECVERMKTAAYAINLFDGYKKVNSSIHFWEKGWAKGLSTNKYKTDHLSTARCVIENDMGYDMITVDFHSQVPKVSSVQFRFSTLLNGQVQSELGYMRFDEDMHKTTICSHNNKAERPVTYSTHSNFARNYQEFGRYDCKSNCPKTDQSTCYKGRDFMLLIWKRERISYFPNGTTLKENPINQYESYFGFYNQTFNYTLEDLRFSQSFSNIIEQ